MRDERSVQGDVVRVSKLAARAEASLGKQGGASPARALCVEPWNSNSLEKPQRALVECPAALGIVRSLGVEEGKETDTYGQGVRT